MTLISSTQLETEHELVIFTEKMLSLAPKGSILLLSGGLSAGKTTLVANFCRLFGLEIVQSPTYSIHHRYSNSKVVIDHYDLYRLESEEDIESAGFFDLLNTAADYKFVEWPDRVKLQDYPQSATVFLIEIKVAGTGTRLLDVYKVS